LLKLAFVTPLLTFFGVIAIFKAFAKMLDV
jgi:hypothetical protein